MPPKLNYGLNLPNKKNSSGSSPLSRQAAGGQKRKKKIFDSDSDDDDTHHESQNNSIEITTFDELLPTEPKVGCEEPQPRRKPTPPQNAPQNKYHLNLSSLHSSKKHAQTAESIDPNIYDYDAVYDSIHARPSSSNAASGSSSQGPKYMTSLLRSAEIRKRDQLRARDKLLAREREAEGDEYADKEKFVTGAYKAQQEEVRRIEVEEAEREKEEEERRRKGGGMMGFYKDVLARDEKKHDEAVKAAEDAVQNGTTAAIVEDSKDTEAEEKSAVQIALELNAQGANIVVNDEGQIVDKRQLLSAGLNVAPRPQAKVTATPEVPDSRNRRAQFVSRDAHVSSALAGQRTRQTEMLALQLEERTRREQEEEEAKQSELAEKNKSQKTSSDVQSAKERYLARKREREIAQKR